MSLKGKHVLITGAGKRIGRALALRCLEEGARVSAHYRESADEIASLLSWAQSQGKVLHPERADLAQWTEIEKAVHSAHQTLGNFDVLINSASIFHRTPLDQISEADWERFLNVNLTGQFAFARAVRRHMPTGVIINVGDSHATHTRKHFTPYIGSKAALLQLTKNLAAEWAPHIRVNSVSPGPVLEPEDYTPEQVARAAGTTLLGRWGQPQDVVEAVLFLIRATYVTGFDLVVDGGRR